MTTAVKTDAAVSSFSQANFEGFLGARDEPDWLGELRQQSWSDFESAAWPTGRDEEWMRTDIRLFKLDKFQMSNDEGTGPEEAQALLSHGVDLAGQVRSVNGECVYEDVSAELEKKGVLFGSLDRLVNEHGDVLRPYFEQRIVNPSRDRFAMLNAACWSSGAVLFVPKGVVLDQPLHVIASLSGAGAADISKTMVILEEGAEATLLMETASATENDPGMHCGSIEMLIGKDAKLRYVSLQNWNDKTWHFASQKALIGKSGRLQGTIGALGARLAHVNQEVSLDGEDAEAQVNGVMFTQGKQHLSYNTHQHHRAPYCQSDLLYKSALQDKSRTVWRGMIQVDKPAQRTNAYQRNDNLMLAESARSDSIPGLEIEADDVRCTHGSTSGKVDETQIFYAMTRGYTRKEAIRMIVTGFFQQVFDRITIVSVRDALTDAISRRVRDIETE